MSIRIALSAAAMTVVMTQAASAAMVTFTNNTLWSSFSAAQGKTVATESFDSYNGFYLNGLTGNAGGIQWTASAPGELYAGSGYMSTNSAEALLTFNLSPSVQGVAGNFFSTDASFNILPAIIGVQLADGSAYVGYALSVADFVGFYSLPSPAFQCLWQATCPLEPTSPPLTTSTLRLGRCQRQAPRRFLVWPRL